MATRVRLRAVASRESAVGDSLEVELEEGLSLYSLEPRSAYGLRIGLIVLYLLTLYTGRVCFVLTVPCNLWARFWFLRLNARSGKCAPTDRLQINLVKMRVVC